MIMKKNKMLISIIRLLLFCLAVSYIVVTGVFLCVIGKSCGWNELGWRISLFLLCPVAFAKIVAAGDVFIERFVLRNDNLTIINDGNLPIAILSLALDITWLCLYSRLVMGVHELIKQLGTSVLSYGILRLSFTLYVCVTIVLIVFVTVLDTKTGRVFVCWMKWRISCGDR